jgi:CheY-like chemotaxis protein
MGGDHSVIILLVEDDPDLLEIIEEVLSEESYQVITARSGREALQIARWKRPHLLLTDYLLVGSMDGITLCDMLRAMPDLADTPMLVMSADPPYEALRERQIPIMQKPFDLDDLLVQIGHLMDSVGVPA